MNIGELTPDLKVLIDAEIASQGGNGNGGSQPGAVRLLDLGILNAVDLLGGTVTLYTPDVGEIVGPILLRDVTFVLTSGTVIIRGPEFDPFDVTTVPLAIFDSDLARDGFGVTSEVSDGQKSAAVTTTGVVKATLSTGTATQFAEPWQAEHAYDGASFSANVLGDGHLWYTSDTGDSGASEPDWTANFGGDVTDGDLTWSDNGPVTDGSAHVYAYVSTPVTP